MTQYSGIVSVSDHTGSKGNLRAAIFFRGKSLGVIHALSLTGRIEPLFRAVALSGALLFILVAGCNRSSGEVCFADSDCGADEACVFGECVSRPQNTGDDFIPPSGSPRSRRAIR